MLVHGPSSCAEDRPTQRGQPSATAQCRTSHPATGRTCGLTIRAEASDTLRGLIDRLVLTPDADAPDGLRVELYGDLAEIMALGDTGIGQGVERTARSGLRVKAAVGTSVLGGQMSLVAGTQNHRALTMRPVTC